VILALGSQGQLSNSVRFGISSVFAWNRSIEVDYFRRSFLWEKKIISPEQLPNGFITNCFINKNISFKVKDDQHQIRLYLQFQNLFNMQFSVFAFEQTRYDYKGHDPLKFAPKYLQGYPLNVLTSNYLSNQLNFYEKNTNYFFYLYGIYFINFCLFKTSFFC